MHVVVENGENKRMRAIKRSWEFFQRAFRGCDEDKEIGDGGERTRRGAEKRDAEKDGGGGAVGQAD